MEHSHLQGRRGRTGGRGKGFEGWGMESVVGGEYTSTAVGEGVDGF